MEALTIAYILIGCGVVCLIAEFFVPTGVLFFIAIGCFIIGVALTFAYGDTQTGLRTLFIVFVGIPIFLFAWFWLWPESLWGSRLKPPGEDEGTVASMAGNQLLESLRGRIGKSVSALRPSGIVDFDGKRVDCISEGMMIEAGKQVRCVDVKSNKVVVREIQQSNLETFETNHFGES